MRLTAAVKIAGGAALVVAVAVIAASKSIDFDRYKGTLADFVQAETGRKLTFAGPLRLRLGLVPSLIAEGVSLANAPGGSRPEMIHIERVEAEIALPALLRKEVLVQRLIISSPDILLENHNWDLSLPAQGQAPTTSTPTRFNLRELKIKNGHITWRDGQGETSVNLHKLSILPEPGVPGGDLGVSMVGDRDGKMFDLAGKIGDLGAAQAGKPWPVSLKASAPGGIVTVNGAIGRLTELAGIDVKLTAQIDELGDALRLAGLTPANDTRPLGSVRLAARLTGSLASPSLADIDLAAGRRDGVVLAVKGAIKDLRGLSGMDLAVQADGDSLAGLSPLAGTPLPPVGPLHAAAALRDGHGGWTLSDLKASLGGSDLAGEISYLSKPRPHVSATLAARQLAVSDLTTPAAPRPGQTAAAITPLPPPPAPSTPGDGRLVPDIAVPVAALTAMNAELTLHAERLLLPGLALSAVNAQIQVKDGRAVLAPFQASLAGGSLTGEARLDGHAALPTVELRLDGHAIDAGQILHDAGIDALSGAPSELTLRLSSKGAGLRPWLANATGSVLVSAGPGQLRNAALGWAAGDLPTRLIGALDPGASSRDTTQLSCAVAQFRLKNGKATSERGLAAETDATLVTGSGTIDLGDESIDMAFAPRATDGLGLSVGAQVAGLTRLGGSLGHPSLTLDEMGVARGALSAAAAASTGGLSLLGEALWDRATADSHPCQTALAMGRAAPKSPAKPTPAKTGSKSKPGMLERLFGR